MILNLGNWNCPNGCRGSYYFTVGVKQNVQISQVHFCHVCGTLEGWRIDEDGNKLQLSKVSSKDDAPVAESDE